MRVVSATPTSRIRNEYGVTYSLIDMSIEVMSWVLNNAPVRGTEKIILLGLANHADADGNNAYPSVARLARYANVSERAVQQALRILEEGGHIYRHFNEGGSAQQRADRRPNKYTVLMRGVKPASPRTDNGVKSSASRGEEQRTNGVKPTSPESSLEPSTEPSTIYVPTQESERLANLLADSVERRTNRRPTVTKAWITSMDRMLRLDERTPQDIEGCIGWVEQHDFWSTNILSPDKLRKHFDRLKLQAQSERKRTEPRGFSGIRDYLAEHGVEL